MDKLDKVMDALERCLDASGACTGCYLCDCPGCCDQLNLDALDVIKRLNRQLKYARAERDAAHARIARIIGEREKVWLDEK